MSEPETVDVKIPANILKASKLVCDRFNVDLDEFIADALKGNLEASIFGDFEYLRNREPVALMVQPETAIFIQWWFQTAKNRGNMGGLNDFLMDSAREFMCKHNYFGNFTEEEREELRTILGQYKAEDLDAFKTQIEDLLKGEAP